MRPSIWTGTYRSSHDWTSSTAARHDVDRVHSAIEEMLLHPLHGATITAWCSGCTAPRPMRFDWMFGAVMPDGRLRLAQTETGHCQACGLNSRMRAVVDLLRTLDLSGTCLLGEQVTPTRPVLEGLFSTLIASEYLGDGLVPGSTHMNQQVAVRHEDFTRLSLRDASVDVVVTQDVFEHIADYSAAFRECHRVLRPGGRLVFSIPFFPEQETIDVIAVVGDDGTIVHVGEPEIHGNPLGGGSLCFQHFGWNVLQRLREAGFAISTAHTYRGAWQGHFHGPSFVFEAVA